MAFLLASTGAAWAGVLAGILASAVSVVAMYVVTRRGVTVEDSRTRARQLQECQQALARCQEDRRELRDENLDLHRRLHREDDSRRQSR
jgi:hypothetical protein